MKSDIISIIQDAKDLFGLEFESIIVGTENKDTYILKSYIDEDKNNRDFICLEWRRHENSSIFDINDSTKNKTYRRNTESFLP